MVGFGLSIFLNKFYADDISEISLLAKLYKHKFYEIYINSWLDLAHLLSKVRLIFV